MLCLVAVSGVFSSGCGPVFSPVSKDCFSCIALAAALLGQAKFTKGIVPTLNSENIPFPVYRAVLGMNATRNQSSSIRLCSVPLTQLQKARNPDAERVWKL